MRVVARAAGLAGLVARWGAPALRACVAFATFSLIPVFLPRRADYDLGPARIQPAMLALHAAAIAAFAGLSYQAFGGSSGLASPGDLIVFAWVIAGILAIAFGVCAFIPLHACIAIARGNRGVLLCGILAAIAAATAGTWIRALWKPSAGITFAVVQLMLRPFLAHVTADPSTNTIGSGGFVVQIAPECSGLEGAALIVVFAAAWLWIFRREYRFPHVLAIVPAGVLLMWVLNAVRISALILIGTAGAADIALGGFHSQGGWIAFNAAAVCMALVVQRIPALRVQERVEQPHKTERNTAAAYLLPFLAILAAGMISRAASAGSPGGFERLYPLRFFAAAVVLWIYRDAYRKMNWRFGWTSLLGGAAVFAMWIALDRWSAPSHSAAPTPPVIWIVFRVVAAVITVPIAEELAFRAYLLREIPWRSTALAIAVSSLAFGLLHDGRWLAGTAAGAIYAALFIRRGRIGDAAAAHAFTNALLAAYVLASRNWSLW